MRSLKSSSAVAKPRVSIGKKSAPPAAKSSPKKKAAAAPRASTTGADPIDDIFEQIRQAKADAAPKSARPAPVVQVRTAAPVDDDLGLSRDGAAGQPQNRTCDGLRVFTAEELKIGQGGGTPLCPFDCDCCF